VGEDQGVGGGGCEWRGEGCWMEEGLLRIGWEKEVKGKEGRIEGEALFPRWGGKEGGGRERGGVR